MELLKQPQEISGSSRPVRNIGASVNSGEDIGEITSGTSRGGSIKNDVSATGNIGAILALGEWWFPPRNPFTAMTPCRRRVWNGYRVKEAWVLYAAQTGQYPFLGIEGQIEGHIKAGGNIGDVTVFGKISNGIEAGGSLGVVWALGPIEGEIVSQTGSITLESWDTVSDNVTANGGGVIITAYGSVTGDVIGKAGSVEVISWGSVTKKVQGEGDTNIWAYQDSKGDVISKKGSVTDQAMRTITSKVEAEITATVESNYIRTELIEAATSSPFVFSTGKMDVKKLRFVGKAWLIAKDTIEAPDINPSYGEQYLVSKVELVTYDGIRNTNIGSNVGELTVYAAGDVDLNSQADGEVKIESNALKGTITNADSVTVKAVGDSSADITANTSIDLMTYGAMKGDLTTTGDDESWIATVRWSRSPARFIRAVASP